MKTLIMASVNFKHARVALNFKHIHFILMHALRSYSLSEIECVASCDIDKTNSELTVTTTKNYLINAAGRTVHDRRYYYYYRYHHHHHA